MSKKAKTPEVVKATEVESMDQMSKELLKAWNEGMDAETEEKFGFETESFNGRVQGLNGEIKSLIKKGEGFEKQIATKMDEMFTIFLAETSGVEKDIRVAKRVSVENFIIYSEAEFGFQKSRALDYQSVGCKPEVMVLDMPFSLLVELARLTGDEFKELLRMFPEDVLQTLSFREMKALVRTYNDRKRHSKKTLKLVKSGKVDKATETAQDDSQEAPQATQEAKIATVAQEPSNVVPMPMSSSNDAIEKLIRQFEAIKQNYKAEEIQAKYAQDLESMAKWCLAASALHLDKRERA
jgi:hypothetical protein